MLRWWHHHILITDRLIYYMNLDTNTYPFDRLFTWEANIQVLGGVALCTDRFAVLLVERGLCYWYVAFPAREVLWMPWLFQGCDNPLGDDFITLCANCLWLKKNKEIFETIVNLPLFFFIFFQVLWNEAARDVTHSFCEEWVTIAIYGFHGFLNRSSILGAHVELFLLFLFCFDGLVTKNFKWRREEMNFNCA